jgi:predicted nucleic acid-binding protein
MRSLLIDSDVLIDLLRKIASARAFFDAEIKVGSGLFCSVISRTEILAGIRQGEEDAIRALFSIVTPVDVDIAIADRAGEFLRKYAKSHAVGIGDALIAGTAHEMKLVLITRNVKHYPMKGMQIVKPY